jgi:hypothetical protein
VIRFGGAKAAAFLLQFKYEAIQRLSQLFRKVFETFVPKTFRGNAENRRTTIAGIHQLEKMRFRA